MTRKTYDRRRVLQGAGVGMAAATAGCLPGGGGGGQEQDRSAEIYVLTDYSGERWDPKWEEVVSGFEEQDEATVNVQTVGMQGEGEDRLQQLIQGGNPPEFYHGTITQVGDLIARGQTENLDDLLSDLADANGEELSPSSSRAEGTARMVPHGLYLGGCLNYRTDIFQQLGLDVPQTMDELVENARVIDESDEVDACGFLVAGAPSGKSGSDFSNFLYNYGGDMWRYTNEDENEVELNFQDEHVVPAMETINELAQYSLDPADKSWSQTITEWLQGNAAMCFMNNAWLNGAAYANESPVWQVTEQSLIPLADQSLDPIDRGWALVDGTPILSGADNRAGAEALMRYMYEGPNRQADKNLVEPMRFLPPYADVVESDTYTNAEIFQNEPSLLERNQRMVEEFAPDLGGDRPSSVASLYAGRFSIDSEMVASVVVDGTPIDEAVSTARERFQTRLEEGRNLG